MLNLSAIALLFLQNLTHLDSKFTTKSSKNENLNKLLEVKSYTKHYNTKPTMQATEFVVDLANFQATQFVEKKLPDTLEANQAIFKIDKFSFTSNNITYAIVGDRIGYWKFFPTKEGYGIIPAWGFADVVVSNHPDIKVGERFYGYFPMASHLLVQANKVQPYGFMDSISHRTSLPPIYNYYTNVGQDPIHSPEQEDLQSIFRPLFTTSFLIDDLFYEQDYFGTQNIVITSASSKTAQALAFLLASRKKTQNLTISIIGLTSGNNEDFVKQLGWYDQVLSYDKIDQLDNNQPHAIVDFTGNHQTQYTLQTHLGMQLKYNCLVGLVDWQHLEGEKPLPKKGEFFFAPTYAEQRQKAWGPAGFQQRVGQAWQQFIVSVKDSLQIAEPVSNKGVEKLYLEMLGGKIDPKKGYMVSIQG